MLSKVTKPYGYIANWEERFSFLFTQTSHAEKKTKYDSNGPGLNSTPLTVQDDIKT